MSPVDICNQALAHIGDRRITSLSDAAQASNAIVRYCAEFYAQARTEALAAHRWSFAKRAVKLVRRTGAFTIGNFQFVHIMPVDCLRLMDLIRGGPPVDGVDPSYSGKIDRFRLVGPDVWSNTEYVAAWYIADITDPNEWSPHFRGAVSRLLAHYLSGPIADDPQMALKHLDFYEKNALPNAQFYDSVQDESNENSDSDVRRANDPLLRERRMSGYSSYGPLDDDGT